MKPSKRVQMVPASKTLEVNALAQVLRAKGIDVVNLTAGEPDFPTPEPVVEAAIDAMKKGFTKYTDSSGIPQLRERIAKYVTEKFGVKCQPEQVIVSNGGKQAIFNALAAVVDEGDEVIIIDPCWVSYEPMVTLLGGKAVHVETKFADGFVPKVAEIEKKISPNTKAIIVNSPNNPSGAVYDFETLKGIYELAVKYDLLIISDEVYSCLVYDQDHISLFSISNGDRTALVDAFSKSHSMTGWRVGYLVAPLEIAKAAAKVQSHLTSNINTPTQYAALKTFEVDTSYMKAKFKERRDLVCKLLDEAKIPYVKPKGAFYFLLDISKYEQDDVKFCKDLLNEKHVALVPGSAFNAPGFVRLSFATSEEVLKEGIKRIAEFIAKR
ncbi:aspartate aminotransferase [Pseudothermotoga thermarum]|uniref:L-aspartate aminotransferase apoenzyme n=1 Tax=Pseudothermotoga thermarum DSM 5069 TaxID=688269 RepID=F7YUE2_9THEM|nr:aspartate aminotransferase [Pseudothermotoga thermarum]AEH51341.1 L-aspartate aminotransferase apoenzyme [Pseudothermotoga thermarum DSM 5069]